MRHLLRPVVAVLVLAGCALTASAAPAAEDSRNATWHIGLPELWGKDDRGESRNLDIYAVFEDGKWARAVATARRFNTSIHLIDEADVKLDGLNVAGRLKVTLTPDRWVPKDGRCIHLDVVFDGKLDPGDLRLSGTYTGKLGGQTVKGTLMGGAGPTETDWDDAVWTASLNQVTEPGGTDLPMVQVTLGVAGGKVQWGRTGVAWRRGPHRECLFDVSSLTLDGATITGTVTVPNRIIHVGGDPKVVCEVDLLMHRVQGLNGGRARITAKRDGKTLGNPTMAYGRGSAGRGGGKLDPSAPKPLWGYEVDNDPWWVAVEGFKRPESGEHPRLWFRKADIPALRKKAGTETGKAILARLRVLLNGSDGESLPSVFNTTPADNHDKSPKFKPGVFTTWHGAGYGFLHVVTGEKKYADLAREAVGLCFDGKMDRDNRYGWAMPGTALRCGSIITAIGLAHDFCYDAWPEDFRRKVALEIQNFDKEVASGGRVDLKHLAGRTGYPPSSNHYGAHMGAATALLAILGDPGTDTNVLTERLAEFEANLPRILAHGFGDHGWYSEGPHPSRVSANCGMQELLAALRCAAGRDYITPRANTQWITLRWIMEIVPRGGKPSFPSRGTYGGEYFDGEGQSHSGEIAYGFGTIGEQYKPALLWVYENFVKPDRHHYGANTYPHRAVAAFVNWPVGAEPVNPGTVMPKAVADTIHGYFVSRNRWKDADDVVITNLLGIGPEGYHRVKDGGTLHIWGLGTKCYWKTGLG
ncbi:MAG: hypothetical protein AMS14_08830, partial [Planctomycetes bacterium DG_20]